MLADEKYHQDPGQVVVLVIHLYLLHLFCDVYSLLKKNFKTVFEIIIDLYYFTFLLNKEILPFLIYKNLCFLMSFFPQSLLTDIFLGAKITVTLVC